MKILCFGASSSKDSINKKLAIYAASLIEGAEVDVLDLNDYLMPIYSTDIEREMGIPAEAVAFKARLDACDGVIISFAEHNGAYTTAFKNIMDWKSRIPESKLWENKAMFVLTTSPGQRGGSNVISIVKNHFPHQGADIKASFSLPSYYQNYAEADGIVDSGLRQEFETQLSAFRKSLGAEG